jgi:hypothetical protein
LAEVKRSKHSGAISDIPPRTGWARARNSRWSILGKIRSTALRLNAVFLTHAEKGPKQFPAQPDAADRERLQLAVT